MAVRIPYFMRKYTHTNTIRTLSVLHHTNGLQQDVTHFGERTVPMTAKQPLVNEVFDRVAQRYDVMNDAMSIGMHRMWKKHLVEMLNPAQTVRHLDVAGGTGDVAFRVWQAAGGGRATSVTTYATNSTQKPHIVVCDINANMLKVGERRANELGLSAEQIAFVEGNAECLPFEDNSFDSYTIAFGLRNVPHTQQALQEAHRVLRHGGRFLCLEFSRVTNPLIRQLYDVYSYNVIPVMGQAIANDRESYQYLVESIRKFPDQDTLLQMLRDAGFKAANYSNLTGGICAIHSGFKL